MRGTTVWKCVLSGLGTLALGATTAHAQLVNTSTTNTGTARLGSAHLIEWDLPVTMDFNPGAVVVDTRGEDNNRAWFVTRIGQRRKVYKFDFGPSLMKNNGNARWTSWDLAEEDEMNNGGIAKLRPSHDRRYVIVRTPSTLQEIDTQACFAGTATYAVQCMPGLRVWNFTEPESSGPFVSDIAVDDSRRIFTVGRTNLTDGYVQMIVPSKVAYTSSTLPVEAPTGTVTRWRVDGVNQCGQNPTSGTVGISGFCNSGIDLQPESKAQHPIYFSNQGQNSVDELNINTNAIRRWALPLDNGNQPITEPRQLKIDTNGIVWVVTGSGHVVSINPKNSSGCPSGYNRITRHRIPINPGVDTTSNDAWGVAPDSDVIGYTDANNSKVGMLLPHDGGACVKPAPYAALRRDIAATVTTAPTFVASDVTPAMPKIVLKQTTTKQDGTFVEAVLNKPAPNADPTLTPPNSLSPLGITPVKWKGQGTFFYAVGFTAGADPLNPGGPSMAKRVGFVRLGVPEKIKNPRDDDDDDDGMDRNGHPGWHNPEPGDDDADGVPDEHDTPNNRENLSSYDPAPTPAFSSTAYYPVTTTASTMTLVATAKSDDPLATIAVDVYDAMGLLVATSGPVPGLATVAMLAPGAGTFNVSVRNLSGRAVNVTPTVLTREPPM